MNRLVKISIATGATVVLALAGLSVSAQDTRERGQVGCDAAESAHKGAEAHGQDMHKRKGAMHARMGDMHKRMEQHGNHSGEGVKNPEAEEHKH